MAITVTLHESEAVFTCGALESQIENTRKFLKDTDPKYGHLNTPHRESVAVMIEAHRTLLVALRSAGYPMTDRDIAKEL